MQYDCILWDVDDTLLDFGAAENYSFNKTMREAGLPSDADSHRLYSEYNNMLWQELNEGRVSKEFLVVERFKRYLGAIGSKADPVKLNEAYLNNLSECSVVMPEAVDTVRALDGLGVRQYVITNAVSFVNRRRVAKSPLSQYFKDIFVSEDIGFAKPDVRYYNAVFDRITGFVKERTIAVGDSVASDICGAHNAGIAACLYNPSGRALCGQADYTISRLSELISIVRDE